MKTVSSFNHYRNKDIAHRIPLVVLLGIVCILTPPLSRLEMDIGLEWLFKLRGERPAPEQVVIITIDKHSADALDLPRHPRKWPRNLHAQLIDRLTSSGASAIGFDIIFSEPREIQDDIAFAEAMMRNGNVVLFDYLNAENIGSAHIEQHQPPIPAFQQAAIAVAPFTLPKLPEKIKQAWLFKSSSGEAATIPVVMLLRHLSPVVGDFNALLAQASAEIETTIKIPRASLSETQPSRAATEYFQLLNAHPEITASVSNAITEMDNPLLQQKMQSLLFAFTSGNGIVLDFYGPPQSLQTIHYSDIIQGKTFDLTNKAVFVGYSEHLQPEQKDGFYTVFTDQAGLDISGVEIMATTLGNLLEGRSVQAFSGYKKLLLIILFGVFSTWILLLFSEYLTILIAAILALAYLGTALYLFTRYAIWIPVTTPLLFQLPAALLFVLSAHILRAASYRKQMENVFRHYLPPLVANTALEAPENDAFIHSQRKFAACLSTDAKAFTQLSEELPPAALHKRLNDYFQLIFPAVYETNGIVIDIVGDAMLAIWHEGDHEQIKNNALQAAQTIQKQLNSGQKSAIETRMGLHCGEISLGNVGSDKHIEYRAVGDAINTTTRIEQLNKKLGTELILSRDILPKNVSSQTNLQTRYLGQFFLRGKKLPVEIFEPLNESNTIQTHKILTKFEFERALGYFQTGNFELAKTIFQKLVIESKDSVAQFYLHQCQEKPDYSFNEDA